MSGTAALIGRLTGSALQRLGSVAFQKLLRVYHIDRAIQGEPTKNSTMATAVNDFEVVIGSWYGELTTPLDNLLRELEKGGIAKRMLECAILDSGIDTVKPLFANLHAKHFGSDGDADKLFASLMASLQASYSLLVKDPAIAEGMKAIHSDLSQRFDSIEQALQSLPLKRAPRLSQGESSQLFLKLARGLQSTYKNIRVETNRGPKEVDISRIYIAPKLRLRENEINSERIALLGQAFKGHAKRGRKLSRNRQQAEQLMLEIDAASSPIISYDELRGSFDRIVVLGDPGGGKSTLCQNLCYDLAKRCAQGVQGESGGTAEAMQLQRLPLRVILRLFEKARNVDPQLTLLDYIVKDQRTHTSADEADIREVLLDSLSTGRAVIAFDGLDEILRTAQRRQFVELVTAFCDEFPLCPAIVTSRLVNYEAAPLPGTFEELLLEQFDDSEVFSYAEKFFAVVARRTKKEAGEVAKAFIAQTSANAADLRKNPLLLGLMAWIFNTRGDVPSNRPEIYQECARLMFERWDEDRDIVAEIPQTFDKLQLFSMLASEIFPNPELANGVDAEWIERQSRVYLEGEFESKVLARETARALVKFITGRAWVMCERGEGIFTFTHQTFLEYFFAQFISDMNDTVAEVMALIMPYVRRSEWEVVAPLALQIKTSRNRRRQDEALEQLTHLIRNEPPGRNKDAIVAFAARAMEYLSGSEQLVRELVCEIFETSFKSASVYTLASIVRLSLASADRRSFVHDIVVELTTSTIIGATPHEFRMIAALLDGLDREHLSDGSRPSRPIVPLQPPLSDRIREHAKSSILPRTCEVAEIAELAWEWYGHIGELEIAKHGLVPYFRAVPPGISIFTDGLAAMALIACGEYNNVFSSTTIDRAQARRALSVIATSSYRLSEAALQEMSKFRRNVSPPVEVWLRIVKSFRHNAEVRVGALISAIANLEVDMRLGLRRVDRERAPDDLKQFADYIAGVIKSLKSVRPDLAQALSEHAKSGSFTSPTSF